MGWGRFEVGVGSWLGGVWFEEGVGWGEIRLRGHGVVGLVGWGRS